MQILCVYAGTSGRTYRNVRPGIYRAEVEATSASNPSVKFTYNIHQIVVPNFDLNCAKCEPGKYQGLASVTVDAPSAIVNINLTKPSVIMCSLNNGSKEFCEFTSNCKLVTISLLVGDDKFTYKNLAVGSHNLVITATEACFPYNDLVYETDFIIGAPGRYHVYSVRMNE